MRLETEGITSSQMHLTFATLFVWKRWTGDLGQVTTMSKLIDTSQEVFKIKCTQDRSIMMPC